MRTIISIFILLSIAHFSFGQEDEYEYDYMFFENSLMPEYYFFSSAIYSDGSYIKNINGKLPVCEEGAFTPPNSLELKYTNGNGKWEASIAFERIRGHDFHKKSKYLSLWIFPENTNVRLYPKIALSIQKRQRRSGVIISDQRSKELSIDKYIGVIEKDGWRLVKIPLTDFGDFESLPNNLVFSNNDNHGEGRILIDQVELLPDVQPGIIQAPDSISAKAYELHVDLIWPHVKNQGIKYIKIYRSEDAKQFKPVGIQRPYFYRYTDFVGESNKTYYYKISYVDYHYNETSPSETTEASTRPFTDEELLNMVQEASFRYYWEGAEPHSGMARENIPGRMYMIATGASGFGIMALIVGAERGFISRAQAVLRMKKITVFLKNCDKFHGAFPHFIDGTTGKTIAYFGKYDNGGDLVETAFLFEGLLTAREYFNLENAKEKEIRKTINQLWEAVEWDWYNRDGKYLTWHWSKEYDWKINHQLIGWNETMIAYILAMASPTHPIDPSTYYKGWASQEKKAIKYREAWGKTRDGSHYTNGNYYHGIKLDVGVAKGGPLFFTHYSYMGMDPHKLTDRYTNYFDNNRNIALINYRYCKENPNARKRFGNPFWGLTASDGPWGYRALEPVKEKEDGTIAPTGALASFPYTPEQSMEALKNMYCKHGKYLWGEYGFRDAVNLDANWQAKIFMGLNQAPVTVMIENYRSGLIWGLFMKNKEIINALNRLSGLK